VSCQIPHQIVEVPAVARRIVYDHIAPQELVQDRFDIYAHGDLNHRPRQACRKIRHEYPQLTEDLLGSDVQLRVAEDERGFHIELWIVGVTEVREPPLGVTELGEVGSD
jgi:hypothetical protein